MLSINYSFSPSFTHSDKDQFSNATEMDLRYSFFLGSIRLSTEQSAIQLDWDWIPIFDFALCMMDIRNSLTVETNGEEEFDFTESDGRLIFRRENDLLKITTSFSNELLETSFNDFNDTVDRFYKTVILDIADKYDNIKSNSIFAKYHRSVLG